MELADRVRAGDRLALSRLLTLLENGDPQGYEALAELYPRGGRAHIIGVTGAPGTGKSTLVNRLVLELRRAGEPAPRVAVLAVDPTSPYSGGAILGDRIRMRDLAGDPGVFIRSMASRGAQGGLARTTATLAEALDAAGYQVIFIETVGAGQAEVEIASTAQTTVLVEAPGMGDDVQAIKAGILEIADILVVNKADLPGADRTLRTLRMALELAHPARWRMRHPGQIPEGVELWMPLVLPTVATTGEGVPELADALRRHRAYLERSGELEAREWDRARHELENLLREALLARFLAQHSDGRFEAALEAVRQRRISPRQAVDHLLGEEVE